MRVISDQLLVNSLIASLTGHNGRYVGDTGGGAPASGSPYQDGDWASDFANATFYFYSGGSWGPLAGGGGGGGAVTIGGSPGVPTTGTFATGAQYMDSIGVMYVCTAGGTPGTWKCPPGQVLGRVNYRPGSLATMTVTGTTPTVFDGTNLSVTITTPPSGNVWVECEAEGAAVTGGLAYWGILQHGTSTLLGDMVYISTTGALRYRMGQLLTGLTANASLTLDWAGANSTGGDGARIFANSSSTPANAGPAIMRILSAA